MHVTAHREESLRRLLAPPFELRRSDPAWSSPNTLQAEDELGLGRCLYFYAGRAMPQFGHVGFAFPPGCEDGHTGSATPCDTGGLVHGGIKLRIRRKATLKKFHDMHRISLWEWRRKFCQYILTCFTHISDYFSRDGRPCSCKKAFGIHDPENDNEVRSWSFEVRFGENHGILDAEAWCCNDWAMRVFSRTWTEEFSGYDEGLQDKLREFRGRAIAVNGAVDYAERLNQWVIEKIEE